MNYDGLINVYNNKQSKFTQKEPNPDFLITNCNNNMDLNSQSNANNLDVFFNQPTPYKFPALIICDDSKRINQSQDIYQKYMDVITDECGNRFNIRNQRDSAGILQAGYSANIDLDSHLKNINFYNDKCYYDNWKLSPNSNIPACNGIKRNAEILTPDYKPVGRHYEDCIGVCSNNAPCWNTPPSDINCENNIRKRYDFSHNKFQMESCIKPGEWKYFKNASAPVANPLEKYPNGTRNQQLINSINQGVQHDFYQFFDNNNVCVTYPNQRLFNNITKRKMLPNQHFRNSNPIYTK